MANATRAMQAMTRMIFCAMGMVGMPSSSTASEVTMRSPKLLDAEPPCDGAEEGVADDGTQAEAAEEGAFSDRPAEACPSADDDPAGRRAASCGCSACSAKARSAKISASMRSCSARSASSSSRSRRARSSSSRRAFSARRASSSSRSSSVSGLAVVSVIANPSHGKGGSRGAAIAYAYRWNAVYPFDAAAFQHGPHSRKSTHRRDTASAAPA